MSVEKSPAPVAPSQSSSGTRRVSDEPPPSIALSPGDLIGQKYRLVRALGEGGMASVWVAHNEALDIHVAVKFIRSELRDSRLADRLLHEARAAARLGHPAIVRVTDFGKTRSGIPFIVMELLDGDDMRTLLDQAGRMDAVQAVRTLLPIIDALALAHDKGIVHRDLKPENIFLARTDGGIRPKLVDFGIARFERPNFKRLTEFGTALGSPGYMSPEQARGGDVDARSDVWALCVVIYELITGDLPFDGDTYNALLRAIIEDEPEPIMSRAAGDAELWAILYRGFQKTPEERWQNMRELGAALAGWLLAHGYNDDIAEHSLQAAWLQARSSSPNDLLTTPTPGRPSLPSLSSLEFLTHPALNPVHQIKADSFAPEAPSLLGVASEPRHSRTPLFGVAAAVVVALAAGIWFWSTHSKAPSANAADSATLAAPGASLTTPVATAAPAPSASAAASSAQVKPAPSSVPSAAPSATASAPHPRPVASARPAQKWRPKKHVPNHWHPKPSGTGNLGIKTTL